MSTTQKAKRLRGPAWVTCLKDLTVNLAGCFFSLIQHYLSFPSLSYPHHPCSSSQSLYPHFSIWPLPLHFLYFHDVVFFFHRGRDGKFFFLSCAKIIVCNKRDLECQTARKQENSGKCGSVEFTSALTVAFQHVAKCLVAKILMGNYN